MGIDDDDFDLAFEELSGMSDAQVDAMLNREMAEFDRWYDGLLPDQRYAVDRRNALRRILQNRARLRRPELCTIEFVVGLWREGIRRNQRRLVKIRTERSTGIYPGQG